MRCGWDCSGRRDRCRESEEKSRDGV